MEIIYPIWLTTLISIPIVLVFLLISKKPRKLTVSSLLIWKKIYEIEKLSRSKKSRIDLFTLLIIFVLLFVSLSIAKLSISYSKQDSLNISIFLDDSEFMNNSVSDGRKGIVFCHETIVNNICSKINKNAKYSVYLPILHMHKKDMDISQLRSYLANIKTSGFINYHDYTLKLNSFIHNSPKDSNSIAIIFTPYNVNENINNVKNLIVINPPFTEIPIFPEFIGFDNESILVRLNRITDDYYTLKRINNKGLVLNSDYTVKNAVILNDITDKYGLITLDNRINQYFAENTIYKIGAVGFDNDFIKFFNKISNKVALKDYSDFMNDKNIDAWLIAKSTEIPENYSKPIIYFANMNDNKWFDLKGNIEIVDPLKVVPNELLKGISVSELDFSDAKIIELKSAKWHEQMILSDINTLVGILERGNILRAIINSRIYDNNTSMLMLILNLLDYMSGENIIIRNKYTSYSIDEIMLLINQNVNQLNPKVIDIDVQKIINNKWIEKKISITDKKSINDFKLMLNSGGILSFNQKNYAVNPDISNVSENIAKIDTINNNDAIDKITKNISAKYKNNYYVLDRILILFSIIGLLFIIYYKPKNAS